MTPTTPLQILLVEDDAGVALVVSDLLRSAGYLVEVESDGNSALAHASASRFDLLILDVMLPGRDGFEICEQVRRSGYDGAILMLTARSQVGDRVHGLRRGADDYLTKPFDPEELLARAEALLRRTGKGPRLEVETIEFGLVHVDFRSGHVTRDGKEIQLTPKEFRLLQFLVDRRGQVQSRETLLKELWSERPFITPRTVDVHIAWLRQKLELSPDSPQHILTERGEGYRFVKD